MTVATPVSSVVHIGNGVSVNFPYSFRIPDPDYVKISIRDKATHLVTKVLDVTEYTITGTTWTNYAGGIVTYSPAITADQEIVIERIVTVDQQLDINNQGGFYADSIEQAFDKLTMIDQEHASDLARAIVAPVGETVPDLPSLNTADGKVLGYSDGGFVWVANDAAAVAADVLAAQLAATAAAASETQTGLDVAAIETLFSVLPVRYNKLVDTTRTATTTLVADPDLQIPLAANSLTNIKGEIRYTTTDAGDFKYRHTGPAAPTRVRVDRRAIAPGATADSGIAIDTAFSAGDVVIDGGTGSGVIKIDAFVQNGANAGSFGISWAQNTSDAGNTIVEAGSYLEKAIVPAALIVAFDDATIAKLGEWPHIIYGGRNAAFGSGDASSYVEFIATGYKLTAIMYGNGNNCTLTIDGTPSVLTPPAGWNVVTLFDGLADSAHRVKLQAASGASLACAFDVVDTFSLSSRVSPSITHPTDISNYWMFEIAPFSTYGRLDSLPNYGGGFGFYSHPFSWGKGTGFGIRFKSTTTQIQIFAYGYTGQQFVVIQDGLDVGAPVAIPADGLWGLRTLATGLSGAHEYEIIQTEANSLCTVLAVLADTVDATAHAVRDLDVWYGDSIVVESILTDARQGDAFIVAHAGGRHVYRAGNGGQKASTFGRDNTAQVTGLSQQPVKIFECFGVNDMQLGVSIPTFQADVQTMLVNLRAGCPSAKIYCCGILDVNPTVSNSAQRSAYNAAKAAAVAAIGDPNIVYINRDGWINYATDTYDGLHPNAAGYAKMGAAQLLVM